MGWNSCTTASTWTPPTIAQFKSQFYRDFNYAIASDPNDYSKVCDVDINQAFTDALQNFSPSTFGVTPPQPNGNSLATNAFLYLTAFYLVFNLQNSMKGISAQTNFPINSKSAGGISVSYTLPERYTKSPFLSQYTQNGYGAKYLSLALPYLVGNIRLVSGTTTFT